MTNIAPRSTLTVIAHRGASGERPEHTRAAWELAIEQGADFIEPDLVMSRDGHLVVRHENQIGETTDVADRPEFADRWVTRHIDGRAVTGWFTEDFTLAELRTLRARERLPDLRPRSAAFDGQEPILTFQEVIDIARQAAGRTGRTIGVAPEMKHPSHFAALGLDMEATLAAALIRNGLDGRDAPVIVQCFEVGPLVRLGEKVETPRLQLIALERGPPDRPALGWTDLVSARGLADIAQYADYVGVETALVLPRDAQGRSMAATTLTADAHAAGLKVAVWTLRAENIFLPLEHRRGDAPGGHGDMVGYWENFRDLGVDAVFTDFPNLLTKR